MLGKDKEKKKRRSVLSGTTLSISPHRPLSFESFGSKDEFQDSLNNPLARIILFEIRSGQFSYWASPLPPGQKRLACSPLLLAGASGGAMKKLDPNHREMVDDGVWVKSVIPPC
jgi:hypothetical protein